ncbi:MAG: DUF5611 family protein [Thermoplasmata archaeon]|nr:DUF5611 family protein [Thermoplasmata archaeon]
MQRYPVRTSFRSQLTPEILQGKLAAEFGAAQIAGGVATARYGALERIAVHAEGRELEVTVAMNPKVPEDVARETINRYNRFLEAATGYSAKERAKRLRTSAAASD